MWAAVSESLLEDSCAGEEDRQTDAEVKEAVGLVVATLVDNVVDDVKDTVFLEQSLLKYLAAQSACHI